MYLPRYPECSLHNTRSTVRLMRIFPRNIPSSATPSVTVDTIASNSVILLQKHLKPAFNDFVDKAL